MKKILLPLAFTLFVLLFNSCDDSLPKVTEEDAMTAFYAAIMVMSYDGSDLDGVTITETGTATSGTMKIDLVSVEIPLDFKQTMESQGITIPYTSVSGEIVANYTSSSESFTFNLSLSGGPVVTFYMKASMTSSMIEPDFEVIINGHNMTADLEQAILPYL